MKNRFIKVLIYIGLGVTSIILMLGCIFYITEYRPAEKEYLYTSSEPQMLPDTLIILSWNIGYCGLGDNMDFFYDGGSKVRDTQERTVQNIDAVIEILQASDADIIFLQEVDINSRRSYDINQRLIITESLNGYQDYFAYNYKSLFVPLPLHNPMGKVESGLLMLSRFEPAEVVRYNYPSRFPFPVSMFNLKRCLLSAKFLTSAGDTLMLNNTHNSAFDDGGMRAEEMQFLRDLLCENTSLGNRIITGGDWNQYPPEYVPTEEELGNEFFSPYPVDGSLFQGFMNFVYEDSLPTVRFLDKPYNAGDPATLIDFFMTSYEMEIISIETLNLGFKRSDHNPMLIQVAL